MSVFPTPQPAALGLDGHRVELAAVGATVPLQHDDFTSEIPDDASPDDEALSEFELERTGANDAP